MIKEIEIEGEKVYLNKKKLGWNVVYPLKKDINQPFSFKNNCNWKNLLIGGSWWNVIKITIIVGIILGVIYNYRINTETCIAAIEQINNLGGFLIR